MNEVGFAAASGRPWPTLVRACLDRLDPLRSDGNVLGLAFLADPTGEAANDILNALRQATGVTTWIGATGEGVLAEGRDIAAEGGLAVALLPLGDAAPVLFDPFHPPQRSTAQRPSLAIVHAPGDAPLCPVTLQGLAAASTSTLIGGRGSSGGQFAIGASEGGYSGAVVAPPRGFKVSIAHTHGPLSAPLAVTAAVGGRVFRLNGQPALVALRAAAGELLARDPIRLAHQVHAVRHGAAAEVDPAPVALVRLNEADDSIDIDAPRAGEALTFVRRSPAGALAGLRDLVAGLQRDLGAPPRLALAYASTERGAVLFGPSTSEAAHLQAALGKTPLLGLRTRQEICGEAALSHALVLALIA